MVVKKSLGTLPQIRSKKVKVRFIPRLDKILLSTRGFVAAELKQMPPYYLLQTNKSPGK